MPLVGADLAELSKLVTRLNGPDWQQLTATLNEMNTAIQDSRDYWVSEYGDKFRSDFLSYVTSTQQRLDQVLAGAARITRQNLGAIATATGEGSGPQAGGGNLTAAAAASHGSSIGEDILVGTLGVVGGAGAITAVGLSVNILGETLADAIKAANDAAQDATEAAAEDFGEFGEFL
jgi:hypothetical protein